MRLIASLTVVFSSLLVRLLGPGGTKALIAENLALRHQLLVLNRRRRKAPSLRPIDRLLLGLSAIFIGLRRIPRIAVVVRPSTILQFHRALVRRKHQALFTPKSRSKLGPKGPSTELRAAIVAIKERNPGFGSPRIAMIVSRTFGVEIDKDVVRRVLAKDYRPTPSRNGPSWLSFLGHSADSPWSVDLFRCESIILKSYRVMVVMDQYTRRIVGFGVHQDPIDGATVCRMFNEATAGRSMPRRLSTDHDPLFRAHRWQANLRVLDVEEVKTVPYVPLSHPFIERAIGTVHREYLDQTLFWNSVDLKPQAWRLQALLQFGTRPHRPQRANAGRRRGRNRTRRGKLSRLPMDLLLWRPRSAPGCCVSNVSPLTPGLLSRGPDALGPGQGLSRVAEGHAAAVRRGEGHRTPTRGRCSPSIRLG